MASTSGSSSAQWPTWQGRADARPPASRTSAATASQASALRLTTTTTAPHWPNASTIARPRPWVPPVTTITREVRSNSRRASGCGASDGSVDSSTGPPGSRVRSRREGEAGMAVVPARFTRKPGRHEQLEVSEDLPDDQQRLLTDGAFRPEALRDAVRALGTVQQRPGDAPRAGAVLGDADVDERAVRLHRPAVAGIQDVERHACGPLEVAQVLRPRAWPLALRFAGRGDLGVRGDPGQQVVAHEGLGRLVVHEERVAAAVAGPREHLEVARAGPDRVTVGEAHVGLEGRRVLPQEVPERLVVGDHVVRHPMRRHETVRVGAVPLDVLVPARHIVRGLPDQRDLGAGGLAHSGCQADVVEMVVRAQHELDVLEPYALVAQAGAERLERLIVRRPRVHDGEWVAAQEPRVDRADVHERQRYGADGWRSEWRHLNRIQYGTATTHRQRDFSSK